MKLTKFFQFLKTCILPRWLRRKLKLHPKLRHTILKMTLVTSVIVGGGIGLFCEENVHAQTVSISNDRTDHGNWTGSSTTSWSWTNSDWQSAGMTDMVNNWWGKNATNNVLVHLNSLAATGGTVTISSLDTDAFSSTSPAYYLYDNNTGGYTDGPYYNTVTHPAVNSNLAYTSAFSGSVNVNSTRTTILNATIASPGYTVTGTTTKTGDGRLSLRINGLNMTTFVGSGGTLDLSNSGTGVLATGTLSSANVTFNGGTYSNANLGYAQTSADFLGRPPQTGTPVTGVGANSIATFTFTSGGNTGTANAANLWTIANPITSNGINNMGYITVGGTGLNTLDGTTNIGMRGGDGRGINTVAQNGQMTIAGAVDFGTTGSNNYLNINNANSLLTIGGLFQAGTASGTSGTINHLWGGTFTTSNSSYLGAAAGSNFTANVSNGTWNNTANAGKMSVGQNGSGTLNIFTGLNGMYNNAAANAGIVNTNSLVFAETGTASRGYANVYGQGSQLNVKTGDMTVANAGTAVVNVFNNARVEVNQGNSHVAVLQGSNGTVNIYNGGVMLVDQGNGLIAEQRGTVGTVNVWGAGSTLNYVNGNLITAQDNGTGTGYSQGNLYVWSGAYVHVGGNHIIADGINALGRDYIDGYTTRMIVDGNLIVGNNGQAGGTYTENSYDLRFQVDPANGDWLFDTAYHSQVPLTSITNAKTGALTGNDPGLAITRGAYVRSNTGVVGVSSNGDLTGNPNVNGNPATNPGVWSNGYVVIDNRGNTSGQPVTTYNPLGTMYNPLSNKKPYFPTSYSSYASTWSVDEKLTIAQNGNAFVRVLNGGTLVTGTDGNVAVPVSTVLGDGIGRGSLYVFGNDPLWGRSIWKSYGATVVGTADHARGTVRINDGALGETAGLYIAPYAAGLNNTTNNAEGEVSVTGAASTLHVTANTANPYSIDRSNPDQTAWTTDGKILGQGLFSASDNALVWIDTDSEIRLNGNAEISTDSILHLDNTTKVPSGFFGSSDPAHNAVFDVGTKRMTVNNARVEGIGKITGADGVHIRQDDYWTPGQAEIDPGLVYGWATRCEKDFYGDLTFGHTLNMTGHVITYFDVNSGHDDGTGTGALIPNSVKQDHIYVEADGHNTTDQVRATLSGELLVHARLTNYYDNNLAYNIVTTRSANGLEGRIDSMFDSLTVQPYRFFDDIKQEILLGDGQGQDDINGDGLADDVLYVTMKLNENPFTDAAQTYNQRSLGGALDSIYAMRDQRWLPFLRYFWYLGDPDFLNAYQLFSGEVRAHSMLMPLSSPWTYANDRVGFSRCTGHVFFGPQNRSCNQPSGGGLWGTAIYNKNETSTDGNAGDYDISRWGFVAGYDRAFQGGRSYVGAMFAYNKGNLETWRAGAKSDDLQFGLYHGANICDLWEWKNYLGFGWQNYDMWRTMDMTLSYMDWNDALQTWVCSDKPVVNGKMNSSFNGYTLAGSTELARPYYFGCGKRWTVRPYMALDLNGTWQNAASETGNFENSGLVALNYHDTSNLRVYGRTGLGIERGGTHGNLRGGVSYSYLMGGRRYTNVNNQFQFGGDEFNIRGVDDGSGFLTLNAGANVYLDRCKKTMVFLDYRSLTGSHSTTHAAQLGLQKNF
ncbi:MAG: hypothetical protein FWC50_06435 [Planctomycetaceae bacterium]|nr:hypothetical protein [Planctomycetaceae bacterium]